MYKTCQKHLTMEKVQVSDETKNGNVWCGGWARSPTPGTSLGSNNVNVLADTLVQDKGKMMHSARMSEAL